MTVDRLRTFVSRERWYFMIRLMIRRVWIDYSNNGEWR